MDDKESKKFPNVVGRSEIKRIVFCTKQNQPNCRFGQAVVNTYKDLPESLEDKIYESDDVDFVTQKLFDWCFYDIS